jgi:prolyl-tRNA synthetase
VAAVRQAKTLVYLAQGEPLVVLLRGDHALSEAKLALATGTDDLRPATEAEAREVMGAGFGSLGPVGVGARVLADRALEGRRGLVSGANRDGYHLAGLEPGRDFAARFADLRTVRAGEVAPDGSGPVEVRRGLELGHIFKLGTRYSSALGVTVQDGSGKARPLVMGSYGIGVERLMAAVAERYADDRGLRWPREVAPFDALVLELGGAGGAAERLYQDLRSAGLETLFDDRDERAGVKFAEADLVGVPVQVVVGARGLERGVVELRDRAAGTALEVPFGEVVGRVAGSAGAS